MGKPLKTDETWTLACRLAGMADERVRTIRIDEKLRDARLAGIRQGRKDALALLPGGTHCDPQEIADAIRALPDPAPGQEEEPATALQLCQQAPLFMDALDRAGLHKTARLMDAVVKSIGYETAEKLP